MTQNGTLTLGQFVFSPTAARITAPRHEHRRSAGPPSPGRQILTATSTSRVVTIDLEADQQGEVKVGDKVSITLPNGQTTPGTVTSVGTVATTAQRAAPAPDHHRAGGTRRPQGHGQPRPGLGRGFDHHEHGQDRVGRAGRRAPCACRAAATPRGGRGPGCPHPRAGHPGLFDDANGPVQVSGPASRPANASSSRPRERGTEVHDHRPRRGRNGSRLQGEPGDARGRGTPIVLELEQVTKPYAGEPPVTALAACPSPSREGSWSPSSGHRDPARPRCCISWGRSTARVRARCGSPDSTSRASRTANSPRCGPTASASCSNSSSSPSTPPRSRTSPTGCSTREPTCEPATVLPARRSDVSGSGTARRRGRTSYRAASASASPSHAPWSGDRPSCWLTSRRGTSTAAPAAPSSPSSRSSTRREPPSRHHARPRPGGRLPRQVEMLDGRIVADTALRRRRRAHPRRRARRRWERHPAVNNGSLTLAPKNLSLGDLLRVASVGLRTRRLRAALSVARHRHRRGGDRRRARSLVVVAGRPAGRDRPARHEPAQVTNGQTISARRRSCPKAAPG